MASEETTSAPEAPPDTLRDVAWECASSPAGTITGPLDLGLSDLDWIPAEVPGTVAGALAAAGRWRWDEQDSAALDGRDWWFRCEFEGDPIADRRLECEGLATLAEVWINGRTVLSSDNMWVPQAAEVELRAGRNQLVIRFAALEPFLQQRRPRPRWRTGLLRHQNLRWVRTALPGRIPGWAAAAAPVGPWRPIRLLAAQRQVTARRVSVRCDGGDGLLTIELTVQGIDNETPVEVWCEGHVTPAVLEPDRGTYSARVVIREVQRWWPHTHGDPFLYPVEIALDGEVLERFRVGFRTVTILRVDGGFTPLVNGQPTFCRGACWSEPDPVSLTPSDQQLRRSLDLLRQAGGNMVRLGGYGFYQSSTFWDLCDELGILVWQDCMMAAYDPPDDERWTDALIEEIRVVLEPLGRHPSLAVVCGSSETYQQAAMWGLPAERRDVPLLEQAIPAVLGDVLPGIPYVPSTPSGGDPPFVPSVGVSHYFGVGAFLRPPAEVRRDGVRFAAECLAFATPPEPRTVEAAFGSAAVAGHDPSWKQGVPRDPGASWDFEDVVDHYVRDLFGIDTLGLRMRDPDRALDLCRAAVCSLMEATFGEWRRPASPCAGGLVLSWQDLWPGAGWGLLDASGRPKAPWYVLRRLLQPRAVWLVDEGLSGYQIHVANDRPEPCEGRLTLQAITGDGTVTAEGALDVNVAAHSADTFGEAMLLGGFRDLGGAYRFGAPAHVAVVARLDGIEGGTVGESIALVAPQVVAAADPSLAGTVAFDPEAGWSARIRCDGPAHWVAFSVDGWDMSDNWFHLLPGRERCVALTPSDGTTAAPDEPPKVRVRAVNARYELLLAVGD